MILQAEATNFGRVRPPQPLPLWEETVEPAPLRPLPADVCLSVVIPVYNERNTLAEILRRIRAVPIAKEIIVVDDGSTDGTRELLRSMEADEDLRIIYHPTNRGKGAALRTAFAHATGAIVIVQDADLEYDPADYPRLIQPIIDGRADAVYGSRFLNPEGRRSLRYWHFLANRLLTGFSNMLTNLSLTDMETCYKVFRREKIQEIAPCLRQDRFGIEPEITARLARSGCRIHEVSVAYHARSRRDGKKIGWRDGVNALWCILRYARWN